MPGFFILKINGQLERAWFGRGCCLENSLSVKLQEFESLSLRICFKIITFDCEGKGYQSIFILKQLVFWQSWSMHWTENPWNKVRFLETPQIGSQVNWQSFLTGPTWKHSSMAEQPVKQSMNVRFILFPHILC